MKKTGPDLTVIRGDPIADLTAPPNAAETAKH
jgi:hypothetical protein